ncbi:MAG: Gfo/Idh/MocA family oxidoreductase [Chloroflexi bacterium]|nr:Gfo/Idh/MocA family oxidoreductase [Chloroflexota bacterium]
MKTIRWGIIGCGDVTEVKSGPGFQKAEHSALVAVMRRNGDLAQDYAQRHGVPRWYDNAEALIHDPEVDAVYIATPPYAHLDYTRQVAQAGKPVYVEKPMARTHAECQAMIDACHAANVPLFVAYYRRALPRFVKIKELVQGGTLGEVRTVNIFLARPLDLFPPENLPWRVVPELSGGGHFVDLASHTLDFLDDVLGPIRVAQGMASNQGGAYPAEDVVTGHFVFESGVQGVGTWCSAAHVWQDWCEIIGSHGQLRFSSFGNDPVILTAADGQTKFEINHPPHVQQPLIQTVVNTLNGVGECPSTGESAARASWVIDQLLASYRQQRGL